MARELDCEFLIQMLSRCLATTIDEDDWAGGTFRGTPTNKRWTTIAVLKTTTGLPQYWRDNVRYELSGREIANEQIEFASTDVDDEEKLSTFRDRLAGFAQLAFPDSAILSDSCCERFEAISVEASVRHKFYIYFFPGADSDLTA